MVSSPAPQPPPADGSSNECLMLLLEQERTQLGLIQPQPQKQPQKQKQHAQAAAGDAMRGCQDLCHQLRKMQAGEAALQALSSGHADSGVRCVRLFSVAIVR